MLVDSETLERVEDTKIRKFCEEKIKDNSEKKIEVTPSEIKQLILDTIKGTGWSESTQKIMDQIVDPDHEMINKMKPVED